MCLNDTFGHKHTCSSLKNNSREESTNDPLRCKIDVWYSYDDNTKTDIARASKKYSDTIKVRELICDNVSEESDIIVRVVQQPTCTNACITDEGIEIEIVFELQVEVIGETKMMVTVLSCGNENVNTIDDFENEINEDFIRE